MVDPAGGAPGRHAKEKTPSDCLLSREHERLWVRLQHVHFACCLMGIGHDQLTLPIITTSTVHVPHLPLIGRQAKKYSPVTRLAPPTTCQ